MQRRAWLAWLGKAVAAGCVAATSIHRLSGASQAQEIALRIEMLAGKFAFVPNAVQVSKGQRVTIVLTSPDFVHGFALPDFNVRVDGIPGKTVEVSFVADKAGKFIYLCDNFCGEGHDQMSGFLVVTER